MTANAASATSAERMFSEPKCLAAKKGLRAQVRAGIVSGVGRVIVDRAVYDDELASVVCSRRKEDWGKEKGQEKDRKGKVERKKWRRNVLSNSFNALLHASWKSFSISLGCKPIMRRFSACLRNSQARITTVFVPSQTCVRWEVSGC